MTERMKKALADLKARQESGKYTLCPRCGQDTMRPDLYSNALSRQADVLVCSQCGMTEAKLSFMGAPESLYRWAAFQPDRPKGDFEALTGREAWQIIMEKQATTLFRLYRRYLAGDDPEEIRFLAFESVPGLTQIWTEPYQLKYRCRDGSLIIRFKNNDDGGTEMEADLVEGK